MQIEKITEILNKYFQDSSKGKYIVKRTCETLNPPVYKRFKAELFYAPIGEKDKNPIRKLIVQIIDKCPKGNEDDIWNKLTEQYLLKIFNLIEKYGNINRN